MNPEILQTLFQIGIVIGGILVVLCTFGSSHYGKVVEKNRSQSAQMEQARLESNINKLLKGNQELRHQLAPFEEIAKKIHPGLEIEEAMDKLRHDLSKVESKTGQLERRIAPRTLSPEQLKTIRDTLHHSGSYSISISAISGDQEAFQFAEYLKQAISAGGWQVEGVNQVVRSGPVIGLMISVGADPAPAHANILYQALKVSGFVASGNLDQNLPQGRVDLIVGSNPDGHLKIPHLWPGQNPPGDSM